MQTQAKEYSSEINLYDLWKIIIRRKKIIISLFFISLTATAIISFFMPKVYRGDFVLKIPAFEIATSNITAKELTDSIGQIDRDKMAQILPKTYHMISSIKLDALKESKDKVQVVLESDDVEAFPRAVLELIGYINAIDLMKSTVRDEQEKLVKRSNELSSVIDESAELLTIYGQLLKTGRLIPVGFNPVELNKRISDFKIDKLTTDQTLQRLKAGVDIAKQLYVGNKPVKPRVLMNVIHAGIISLFLGIVLAFFLEYVEKMKKND